MAEWNDGASDYVCGKMFDRKQFVTDADLEISRHIQKLVALELHINRPERQRQFWEEHGGRKGNNQKYCLEKNGRRLKIP